MEEFESPIYVGVTIITSKKPAIHYALLNSHLNLITSGFASIKDMLDTILAYPYAIITVNAPSGPNQGLMADPFFRQRIKPKPLKGRYQKLRYAEYQLSLSGISVPFTPADPEEATNWMKLGFDLYDLMLDEGILPYPADNASRLWMETSVEAAYQLSLGHKLYTRTTLEGQLQRQLHLLQLNLPVMDPMVLFEEVTRFRILTGSLNLSALHPLPLLDSIMAAYVAWLVDKRPNRIHAYGAEDEGLIYLPEISSSSA